MLNTTVARKSTAPPSDACCDASHAAPSARLAPTYAVTPWRNEVAYVIMGYPRLSETFISQEVLVLERLGAKLRIFAIKRGDEDCVHDAVSCIGASLTYLPRMSSLSGRGFIAWLRENVAAYVNQHWNVLKARPWVYVRTLASAIGMCWRYRTSRWAWPKKVFIKEFLQAGYIAAAVLQTPSVRHIHGHFCHGATTVTWFASRLTGRPFSFTAHAKDIYQHDQNPGDLLARKLKAASFVTTCTDANRQHLARTYPDCKQVHTIYHGLDTTYFAAQRHAVAPAVPVILSVGRLVEKKGLAYLVQACHVIKQQALPFRCVIVGEEGNQSEAIKTMIAALGLQTLVELRGPVTHKELRDLYSRASVFVLPCVIAGDGDRDGIPNVLAEAMAMALPVVTTAVSGIPELVRAGIDGVCVPQRDANAIAQALSLLLLDPSLRRQFGTAARARVCSIFDTYRTTLTLKSLFEREASLRFDANPS